MKGKALEKIKHLCIKGKINLNVYSQNTVCYIEIYFIIKLNLYLNTSINSL